jgi:hypothetical protein
VEERDEGELEHLDPRLHLREMVALVHWLVPREGRGGFVDLHEIVW